MKKGGIRMLTPKDFPPGENISWQEVQGGRFGVVFGDFTDQCVLEHARYGDCVSVESIAQDLKISPEEVIFRLGRMAGKVQWTVLRRRNHKLQMLTKLHVRLGIFVRDVLWLDMPVWYTAVDYP